MNLIEEGKDSLELKNYDEAIKIFDQVITLKQWRYEGCYYEALGCHLKGEDIRALKHIKETLSKNQQNSELHSTPRQFYYSLRKLNKALKSYRKALVLDQENLQARNMVLKLRNE